MRPSTPHPLDLRRAGPPATQRVPGRRAAARLAGTALAAALVATTPAPAQASPETLQRSIGNLVQSPLDVVLAPVVAFRTLFINLRDVDDTTAVRVVYAAPGYVWLTGVQAGGGILRGIAGGLELIPGIFLLPFEADLDPLYDPADRGGALVETDNPLAEVSWLEYAPIVTWHVKFGVTYTSAEY